jgi:hypothetical protein
LHKAGREEEVEGEEGRERERLRENKVGAAVTRSLLNSGALLSSSMEREREREREAQRKEDYEGC